MQNETQHIIDTIVIGAGLTGLTTAHTLRKHGKEVVVLEKTNRIGGQNSKLIGKMVSRSKADQTRVL